MSKEFELSNEELLDLLIKDADYPFSGWDFTYIKDRIVEDPLTWSYSSIVIPLVRKSHSLLDMGTGGGELLSSLAPLPANSSATEVYPPNVPIAKKRLEPLGVKVVQIEEEAKLPFDDNEFDLILNRHEWYSPQDVFRILEPGGIFVTQQVGDKNDRKLRFLLSGQEVTEDYFDWNLEIAVKVMKHLCREFNISDNDRDLLIASTYLHDIGLYCMVFIHLFYCSFPASIIKKQKQTLLFA